MNRSRPAAWVLGLLALPLALSPSCNLPKSGRPYVEPPPPDLRPTTIDYADAEAFDALFETALTNQDPVIVIRTTFEKPDWGSRLNAWIAAWNRGGRVDVPKRTTRGQAPAVPTVTVDAESIREFRLLVEGLMNRVEDLAARGSAWWAEERILARRVELLRPYNLRFHQDEARQVQLIFFNGNYAQHYSRFMRTFTDAEGGAEWARTFECSNCLGRRDDAEPGAPLDRLKGRTNGE